MLTTYQAAVLNTILQSNGLKFELYETAKRNQSARALKKKKVHT